MPFPHRLVGPCRTAAAIVLLASVLAPSAHGADKKAAAPPATPKTPILTPAQLSDCLARKDKLAKDTDAAVKAKAAVTADKAEIDSTGKALEEEATTLDRTSEDAVAAYNAKILARNAKVETFRAKAEAYNVEAENVLAAKDAYEKACANRRYDERDLNDLQKKK